MPASAHADLIADVLLRYYREPVAYRLQMLQANEAMGSLDIVVRLALGRQVEFSDGGFETPMATQELARAAYFFIQQTLFRESANHYQVLGLHADASPATIRENHRLLIQVVHPDRRITGVEWPDSVAARVNRAYSILKNPDARAAYDQQLAAGRAPQQPHPRPYSGPGPAPGVGRRRPQGPPLIAIPEWLSAGVGGFVRQNPAITIFAILLSFSAIAIIAVIWSERGATITRSQALATGKPVTAPARATLRSTLDPPTKIAGPGSPGINPKESKGAPPDGQSYAAALARNPEALRPPVLAQLPVSAVMPALPRVTIPAQDPHPLAVPRPRAETESPAARGRAEMVEPVRARAEMAEPVRAADPVAAARPAPIAPIEIFPLARAESRAESPARAEPPAAPKPAVTITPARNTAPAASESAVPPSPAHASLVTRADDSRPPPAALAPNATEVEALMATFISLYEGGKLDAFTGLFDTDARTNEFRGRAAIRADYNELFARSKWRRIKLTQLRWRSDGERTEANGELNVRIGWSDGREVEQKIAIDMELVRLKERVVISKLLQHVRN